jgi:hypothetical protein
MDAMTERIVNAVCCRRPCTERDLRIAETYGLSSAALKEYSFYRLIYPQSRLNAGAAISGPGVDASAVTNETDRH